MADLREWVSELEGELEAPTGDSLPLVLGRATLRGGLQSPRLGDRGRLVLRTLYVTGIRLNELDWLALEDGRLRAGQRWVAADRETLELLGGGIPRASREEVLQWLEVSGLAARFPGCGRRATPQLLRHAFAVHCLNGGMDLLALSRLLGHTDLRTTQMYIPAAMASCREAYGQFHPLSGDRGGGEQADLLEQEVLQLIEAGGSVRDQLMLRVLYAAGLRASELLALGECDIDAPERLLFVRGGKGSQDRYALLDPETLRRLLAYVANLSGSPRIFKTTRAQLFIIVKRAARKVGLLDKYAGLSLSPHSLRHACASHCYQRGMEPDVVRKLLGHEDLRNTLLYIDCPLAAQEREYGQCHPWVLSRS